MALNTVKLSGGVPHLIQSVSTGSVALIVQGVSGQTANVFAVQNSAGSNLFTVDNSGNFTFAGTGTVTINSTVTGNLTVSGTSLLSGAVTASSTLAVTGATTLSSTLSVTGTSTFTGNVSLTNALSVTGTSTFTGYATFNGGMSVLGNSNLSGQVTLANQLFLSNGTATNPALTFSNNQTAGLYRPSSTQMTLASNATDRITLGATTYMIFGDGEATATVNGPTIASPSPTGTNLTGANLTLVSGKGTGNASGGMIIFQVSNLGAGGASQNSLNSVFTISPDVTVGGTVFGTQLKLTSATDNTVFAMASFLSSNGFPRAYFSGGKNSSDTNWIMRFAHQNSSAVLNIPVGFQVSTNITTAYTSASTLNMYIDDTVNNLAQINVINGSASNGTVPIVIGTHNTAASNAFKIDTVANGQIVTITPSAKAGGAASLTVTPAAHTAVTAAVIDFNVASHTMTITGGYVAQTFSQFSQPTISAASSLTVTNALTLSIVPPTVASSAVITNTYALGLGSAVTGVTVANAASSTFALLNTATQTVTLSTQTGTTSTNGVAAISVSQITVAQSGGAVTLTNASGMITISPTPAASVTLTNSYALQVLAAAGTNATNNYGVYIANQSLASGTTAYALYITSQSANATTTGAINVVGTGVNNSITIGNSALMYGNAASNIRIMDATNARGLDFNLSTTTQTIRTTDSTTGTIIFQNNTYTAGATHNAVQINPTWASENQLHFALNISATQNGANTQALKGLVLTVTKDAAASTLATATGVELQVVAGATSTITTGNALNILAPTGGTITTSYGIQIANQSLTGGTTSYAIQIASQTANATTTAAINIAGTGVNNAIIWGASPVQYSSGANVINFMDATNARGITFTLTAAGAQTIAATAGTLTLTAPAIGVATGTSLAVTGNLSSTATTVTLGVGATAIPITNNVVTVTGDGGGNTIATMTGGVSGEVVCLVFADALVTITNNGAAPSANQFDLSAAFTSALHKSLTVVKVAAGYWVECARSANT